MNEERIEKIRHLLQKYWLPILKKRKQMISKIHLSLELQLSVLYSGLTVFIGILIFLPLGYIIYHSELQDAQLSFHYSGQSWTISIVYISSSHVAVCCWYFLDRGIVGEEYKADFCKNE